MAFLHPSAWGWAASLQEPPVPLPALKAVGDFPPAVVAWPVLSEETVVEAAVLCLLPRCRLMVLFRQNLFLRRVGNPWETRWGYQTRQAWALLGSLLFLNSSTGVIHVCSSALTRLWVCDRTNFAFCTSCQQVLACASIRPITWPCFLQSVSGILLLPVTKACMRRSGARAGCICFCVLALSVAAICFLLLSAGK